MKGDFTRDTFDPLKHFSRVLMQQGRVTLDADANEQSAILLHYLRTLARDLIGPCAAPFNARGFVLSSAQPDSKMLIISQGRCYVDGILVENEQDCLYYKPPGSAPAADASLPAQPNYPVVRNDDAFLKQLGATNPAGEYWLYLDVWEQHITPVEDDSIREKALGGPDTCTRAKVVWQVKAMDTDQILSNLEEKLKQLEGRAGTTPDPELKARIERLQQDIRVFPEVITQTPVPATGCTMPLDFFSNLSDASLTARVAPGVKTEDPCVTPPASKYRGAENQLYRVEIHRGGAAGEATFKWSRDNGSVATAWLGANGSDFQVARARGFAAGNWVELSDNNSELLGKPGTLVQLVKVEGDILSVDPATKLPPIANLPTNPKVRRWDHVATGAISLADDNAVPIEESPAGATPEQIVWIDLEDGVQIQFSAGGEYRTGDYWLIPARVATGNIEWPQDDQLNPQPLPPHGVEHHYAPLGFISWNGGNMTIQPCGCILYPLNSCAEFYARPTQRGTVTPTPSPSPIPVKPIKPVRKKSAPSRPQSPSP